MLLYYLEFRVELNNVWCHIFFYLCHRLREKYNLYFFFRFNPIIRIFTINLDDLKKKKKNSFWRYMSHELLFL